MNRRLAIAGTTGALAAVAIAVVVLGDDPPEEVCTTWGAGVTSEPVEVGRFTLYVDEPAQRRAPCRGDDLWHYFDEDLAGVDGVLFDDCVVSWVAGGRTSAAEAGIPCDPAR